MRKTTVAIAALFVTACHQQPSDASAPPAVIDIAPPEWTKGLKLDVRKRSCRITNEAGEVFRVRGTTDIGNGLTATRNRYDCYVQDAEGTKCNWDRRENIDWCRTPNPAYHAYLNAQKNAHMSFSH